MKCPIYGDDRAAKWYYESQRKQLLRQGFVQGYSPDGSCKVKQEYQRIPAASAPCIFYKPETDMVVLVYVDDMLLDGYEPDINIFLDEWHKRFETTDAEWLTDDNPIDFCGIIISQTAGAAIFLSMEPYILKTLDQYGMLDAKPAPLPMTESITDLRPLNFNERKEYMAKMGCCNWLAETTAMHTKQAVHRAAQYMATPCKGALELCNQILRYHLGRPRSALATPLIDPDPPQGHDAWAIYTDSDNSNNPERNNKRRGQFANVIGYRCSTAAAQHVQQLTGIKIPTVIPVMMASKTLSVAFACPAIGQAHASMGGSGENEIYALANTISDILYFSYMLEEMGQTHFPMPCRIFTDAKTAEIFAMGTAARTRLQHIDKRQEWVMMCRDSRISFAKHVKGIFNLADIGTKCFGGKPREFASMVDKMFCNAPPTAFTISSNDSLPSNHRTTGAT